MRYQMKEKLWAFGDDYRIQDSEGKDVFFVDGKGFSVGKKLSFQDMQGQELAFISQKLFSFRSTFNIYRQGQLFAEVVKEISLFKSKFTVDVPGPNDYSVSGNFMNFEYEFERSGKTVAHVSKKFFSWGDSYGIDIVPGEDDITVLATAVVIDMVCHSKDTGHPGLM